MAYLVIEYGGNCGGFGDRVVGLVGAAVMAERLGRGLLIKHDHPDIRGVLDLGEYDYYRAAPPLQEALVLDCIDRREKYQDLLSTQPLGALWGERSVLLRSNQELAEFLFRNPHLPPRDYGAAMRAAYGDIFTKYLKPAFPIIPAAQDLRPYLGLQLRAGDSFMGAGSYTAARDIPRVVKALADCVRRLFPRFTTIYFSTDCAEAAPMLTAALPGHTIIGDAASCVHWERSCADRAALQALVRDVLLLGRADELMISYWSNFGRIAAQLRGGGEVWTFDPADGAVRRSALAALYAKNPPA